MFLDVWRLFVITVTILVCDFIWLSVNKNLYLGVFSKIQGSPIVFNMLGVFIAYFALIMGAYFTTSFHSGMNGVYATILLFAVAYLVWSGTALALFKDYTLQAAIMDSVWGIILGAIVGYVILLT